jgi:chromosome segregation ATPase
MRDWRNYLNELLLNNERTQARQTLNTLKTYMGQYQRSFNEAERQIEAGEEQLANLGDPDWVETAWESWMDRLRNSAERNIEEGEEKRNAAKRDLAGLSPQVEEATSAWQAAQEAWQETQRV